MRSLVKGEGGLPCADEPSADELARLRRRQRVRRAIAAVCVCLGAFFVYQATRSAVAASSAGLMATPDWTDPGEVFSWLRGRVLSVVWHMRESVNGALPSGDVGLIFKVAVCAVAATVFLRVPRRT